MVDHDAFDRRLADALRGYAAEVPVDIDADAFARSIARSRPQRSGWRAMAFPSFRRSPLAWVVLAALLALGTAIAVLAVGSVLTRDEFAVDSAHPVPDSLRGVFEAQLAVEGPDPGYLEYPWYLLDLRADHFLFGPIASDLSADIRPDDFTAAWAGRVVAFIPEEPGAADLVIRAPGPCGDARYHVLIDDQGLTFTHPEDGCADRVGILTSRPWGHYAPALAAGERYGSWFFAEPFHFVLPQMERGGGPSAYVRTWYGPGRLVIRTSYWSTEFIDDRPVYADICVPSKGTLQDVPATPEAVGDWLRSSSEATVATPTELVVDGRTALRFDIGQSEACVRRTDPASPDVASIDGFRVYAIPTGDDTILYTVSTFGGDIAAGADELVRSMTFD